MPDEFAGRRIIITGAAGAIGAACARQLAERGARLLLIDVNGEALQRVATALPGGPHATAVSRLDSPQSCAAALGSLDGPLYGFVHMAGLFEAHDLTPEARAVYDRTLAANMTNAFDMVCAVLPRFARDEPGRMVFATSLAYRRGSLGRVAYSMAKGGITGLVRALARNLGSRILVNAVAPGVIDSPMAAPVILERRQRILDEIPLGRLGRPEEVAGVVRFLLGEQSTYITGQIINVDGGIINS